MKNATFTTCSVETRQRKLQAYLRQLSENQLTISQQLDLIASVSIDLQYYTFVHSLPDTFLASISSLDLRHSTVVFGEILPGNRQHPPQLLNPSMEAAVVGHGPGSPTIHLYLPKQGTFREENCS